MREASFNNISTQFLPTQRYCACSQKNATDYDERHRLTLNAIISYQELKKYNPKKKKLHGDVSRRVISDRPSRTSRPSRFTPLTDPLDRPTRPSFEEHHEEHIAKYGSGNERRLTGKHETAAMSDFTWGVADRGASIRVGNETFAKGAGYMEDRRPAANVDPYVVTSMLAKTTLLSTTTGGGQGRDGGEGGSSSRGGDLIDELAGLQRVMAATGIDEDPLADDGDSFASSAASRLVPNSYSGGV